MNTSPDYLSIPAEHTLAPDMQALLERFPTARGARLSLFLALTDAPRVMERILRGGMLDAD